jgi:GT2 family glycosyltransferase
MDCLKSPAVSIIIPVHNRKQTTLTCLNHLQQQGDLNCYSVVVVDDGSTDGTASAIAKRFPQVKVLSGDGNLWWTGAIRKGMEYACKQGAEFLFWLNDDCLPQPGAIAYLLSICKTSPKTIIGGQAIDPDTLLPSYGGVISRTFKIEQTNAKTHQLLECDGLNGNLVCMPSSVIEAIGYPDQSRFPHYHADTIYTHFAKQNGYRLLLCGDAIALCKNDHTPISWLLERHSISWLLKQRFTIKSPHYWKAHLGFYQELLGAVGVGVYIYEMLLKFSIVLMVKMLLPYQWKINWKNRKEGIHSQ